MTLKRRDLSLKRRDRKGALPWSALSRLDERQPATPQEPA
jgi:hypothetical protein